MGPTISFKIYDLPELVHHYIGDDIDLEGNFEASWYGDGYDVYGNWLCADSQDVDPQRLLFDGRQLRVGTGSSTRSRTRSREADFSEPWTPPPRTPIDTAPWRSEPDGNTVADVAIAQAPWRDL